MSDHKIVLFQSDGIYLEVQFSQEKDESYILVGCLPAVLMHPLQ